MPTWLTILLRCLAGLVTFGGGAALGANALATNGPASEWVAALLPILAGVLHEHRRHRREHKSQRKAKHGRAEKKSRRGR